MESCTGITTTKCNLNSLIDDYNANYKVKVQMVRGNDVSDWKVKRFQLIESKYIVYFCWLSNDFGTLQGYFLTCVNPNR